MKEDSLIVAAVDFVQEYMQDKEAGHNWWHIERVRRNAMNIYNIENKGDPLVIELAALLHDIGDDKIDPETDGIGLVRSFLSGINASKVIIDAVCEIMAKISFRDNIGAEYERSIELDIVQDADRLDAIGAIGIARAFAYGGSKGNEIYNPEQEVREYKNGRDYGKSDSSTINHFYEKLLKLKDKMNTDSGKMLAEGRHIYMEEFLEKFYGEFNYGN